MTAWHKAQAMLRSTKGITDGDPIYRMLPGKASSWATETHTESRKRSRCNVPMRQLLDAPCCSSAGRIASAKVAASPTSGSVGLHSTMSRALPFLTKRKDPPKTEAEPPPSKRLSFDELNNSAAAAEPAARLQWPPPREVAVAAGAEVPGGAKPIPVTLSTQKRFKYMHDLLLAKTTQSWPVTDKERDQHGFAPPAIKKQLLWWVRDDGLGKGGGILLEAAWFDTLMGLEREGWDRSDTRMPTGRPATAPR